jgi:hypothetical protein
MQWLPIVDGVVGVTRRDCQMHGGKIRFARFLDLVSKSLHAELHDQMLEPGIGRGSLDRVQRYTLPGHFLCRRGQRQRHADGNDCGGMR